MKLITLFLLLVSVQSLSASTFDKGMKEYQNKNYKKSSEYFRVACNENVYGACINLGFAHIKGLGVSKDFHKATQYLKKACSEKDNVFGGCTNLAVVYRKHLNDNKKALKYAKLACEKGDSNGCIELGYTYYKLNDKANAKKYYKQSCELENGTGCQYVGALYDNENNAKQAYKFYNDGCNLNIQDSCLNCGIMIKKDDPQKGIMFFKKACKLGSVEACGVINNYKVIKGSELSKNDIRYVFDDRDKKCKNMVLVMGKPMKSILEDLKNNIFWKYKNGNIGMQPNNTALFSSNKRCLDYKKALKSWNE